MKVDTTVQRCRCAAGVPGARRCSSWSSRSSGIPFDITPARRYLFGMAGNYHRMALKFLPHRCPSCSGDLVEIRALGTIELVAACIDGCRLTPGQQRTLRQPSGEILVA